MSVGFFVIDRGVWDHPGFANETFTELQAWFWLISSAAWEPCQVRVGRVTFNLERGQCVFALRFLATKWRWSEPRVRRFLKRRTSDAQVLVLATREATLITICKYNNYQLSRRTDVPEIDAGLNQERRKEEEVNNIINKEDGAGAPPKVVSLTASPEKLFFDQAVQILGPDGRSLAAKLLKSKDRNILAAHSALLTAAQKSNPREYLGAIIRGDDPEERRKKWAF